MEKIETGTKMKNQILTFKKFNIPFENSKKKFP